jgi:hypothetical protein
MCRDCWRRVPRKDQVAVNQTWAAYNTSLRDRAEDRLDKRRLYLMASTAAIQASEAAR